MALFARGRLKSTEFSRHSGSADLLILCSGRLPGYQLPHAFAFSRLSRGAPINRLFIRDNFGLWYHAGLEGLTTGIDDTALHLAEFIDRGAFDRVAIVGVSAGGYAALLFGSLVGVDAIHAIAPRTRLFPDAERFSDRDRYGVAGSLAELHARPDRAEIYFDLRRYLADNPMPAAVCRIYYDPADTLDRFHAENLRELPGIVFVPQPGEGHAMAKTLCSRPEFFDTIFDQPASA